MKVAAIIVTRGDVNLDLILDSIPPEWEVVVWNNASHAPSHGAPRWWRWPPNTVRHYTFGHGGDAQDVSVFGRYAAIAHTEGDVIYVQDDDCVVSNPHALLEQFVVPLWARADHVVCNMPLEFRHDFYADHALVGFGAVFHRDAPKRAFERFDRWQSIQSGPPGQAGLDAERRFRDTCDVVFTTLTPRILADVPKINLPWAEAPNRMYKRGPIHAAERAKMLAWAKEALDYAG